MVENSHSWFDIETHYREAIEYMSAYADIHKAMAGLANWISESDYPNFLFGKTSMHNMMIFQIPSNGMAHHSSQFLSVKPDFKTQMIEFRFVDKEVEKNQWSRIEPPETEALINRMIGFLNQVGWSKDLSKNRPT